MNTERPKYEKPELTGLGSIARQTFFGYSYQNSEFCGGSPCGDKNGYDYSWSWW